MDLVEFKNNIREEIKKTSWENIEEMKEWKIIYNEQEELLKCYKPKTKLTWKGFKKVCPVDGDELTSKIIARKYGVFGMWEYRILKCNCGYKYAISKNI